MAVAERAGHAVRVALVGGRVPGGQRALRAGADPAGRVGLDPHQVFAPYATPHSARHSFALYMLVVLNMLMDQRYGLTEEERRDFRQLYGDPWFMVQQLLGHASRETTVDRYLAPVADLQLRSMLAGAAEPTAAPMPELDAVFARVARESEGIQDLDDLGQALAGGACVSGRGHRASLPAGGHARPEYLVADGQGGAGRAPLQPRGPGPGVRLRVAAGRRADAGARWRPCSPPGARRTAGPCTPRPEECGSACGSSRSSWPASSGRRATWTSSRRRLVRHWRESLRRRAGGHNAFGVVSGLLRDDARLQEGPVADELARRYRASRSTVQSYSEAEFDRITAAARRQFRAALRRISENAMHLQRWREGALAEGSADWVIGEGLDILARTGDLPKYTGKSGKQTVVTGKYRKAFGGMSAAATWQRLFLSRMEAVALGVLLLAEYGWNLSVIDRAEVPRASPDQGEDGHPDLPHTAGEAPPGPRPPPRDPQRH